MQKKEGKKNWVIIGLFWLILFSFGLNWFVFVPKIYLFEGFGWYSSLETHLILAIVALPLIVFTWPAYLFVKKRGPERGITLGALLLVLGFGIQPWMPIDHVLSLYLAGFIAGMGLAVFLVALRPLMQHWFSEQHQYYPTVLALSGVFFGMGIGSLDVDLQNKSMVYSGIAIVSFILWTLYTLKKAHPSSDSNNNGKKELQSLFQDRLAYYYGLLGFFLFGIFLILPIYFNKLYWNGDKGIITGSIFIGCAIGVILTHFLLKKYGLKNMVFALLIGGIFFSFILYYIEAHFIYSFEFDVVNILTYSISGFLLGLCLLSSWWLTLTSMEQDPSLFKNKTAIVPVFYFSMSGVGGLLLPLLYAVVFLHRSMYFSQAMLTIVAFLVICIFLRILVLKKHP